MIYEFPSSFSTAPPVGLELYDQYGGYWELARSSGKSGFPPANIPSCVLIKRSEELLLGISSFILFILNIWSQAWGV